MKKITCFAPTNIAFLKYWGKANSEKQWPCNNSLSMTLSEMGTQVTAMPHDGADHRFCFENQYLSREEKFAQKAYKQLDYLADQLGYKAKLLIESENHLPTACGVASSASGLCALTLGALAAWNQATSFEALAEKHLTPSRIAALTRMGSGSSCRSLLPGYVLWSKGKHPEDQNVTSLFGPWHWQLFDVLVMFSESPKEISSSVGHEMASDSPLFEPRLADLSTRERKLIYGIRTRNIGTVGPLIEQEALDLHSILLTGQKPIRFFTEENIAFLSWIRSLRVNRDLPAYFTMDAGPNVHVICEGFVLERFVKHLQLEWPHLSFIVDRIGEGARFVE